MIIALNFLGEISLIQLNYEKGIKYYEKVLEIKQKIVEGDRGDIAITLINLGDAQSAKMNNNKAI